MTQKTFILSSRNFFFKYLPRNLCDWIWRQNQWCFLKLNKQHLTKIVNPPDSIYLQISPNSDKHIFIREMAIIFYIWKMATNTSRWAVNKNHCSDKKISVANGTWDIFNGLRHPYFQESPNLYNFHKLQNAVRKITVRQSITDVKFIQWNFETRIFLLNHLAADKIRPIGMKQTRVENASTVISKIDPCK